MAKCSSNQRGSDRRAASLRASCMDLRADMAGHVSGKQGTAGKLIKGNGLASRQTPLTYVLDRNAAAPEAANEKGACTYAGPHSV